jgi:hypothetical protein
MPDAANRSSRLRIVYVLVTTIAFSENVLRTSGLQNFSVRNSG